MPWAATTVQCNLPGMQIQSLYIDKPVFFSPATEYPDCTESMENNYSEIALTLLCLTTDQ